MPEHTAPTLISPNSVLANALLRTIDMIRPRVQAMRPARIEFVVGTQINGAPHLGTNLVQSSAFLLAQQARRTFRTWLRSFPRTAFVDEFEQQPLISVCGVVHEI